VRILVTICLRLSNRPRPSRSAPLPCFRKNRFSCNSTGHSLRRARVDAGLAEAAKTLRPADRASGLGTQHPGMGIRDVILPGAHSRDIPV